MGVGTKENRICKKMENLFLMSFFWGSEKEMKTPSEAEKKRKEN